MATEVIMPALGMAQEKGTLINWLKAEGDSVKKGEPLMEIETDKAAVEIEAPASGILANVTASAGDEIPVGQKIAMIFAPGESPAKERERKPSRTPAKPSKPAEVSDREIQSQTSSISGRIAASPAAKRIAKEKGIDIASLKGSGPKGSVVTEDVLRAGGTEKAAPAGPLKIKETVQLTAMRRIVGERMSKSKQTAPHFYVGMDVDMTEVNKRRAAWKEKGEKPTPSINDFILCASARALRDFPSLNAAFSDHGIEIFSEINIGMAVALEEGLVVPVIRNADALSLQEMSKQSGELAEKAQKKRLFPLDYEGGTFTVSNLGMLGVDNFVAIINPPQCAILAVGRVAARVVADNEGITVRPVMTMTLSADHRIVDGAIAARFLQELKRLLQNPDF